MAVEVGEAVLTIIPSAKGMKGRLQSELDPEADNAGDSAGKHFAGKFAAIAGAAIVAGAVGIFKGVGAVLKATVGPASDLNETISKTQVVFGSAADQVLKFAENSATALGQSKREALDGAASFAIFGKSAGLTGNDLVKFSTGLVSTAGDMASFANTSPADALEAISAALRGESEPIRRYGVLLDDATLRQKALALGIITTTKNALTPQQRVIAANSVLLDQLGTKGSNTIGDFARTSAGLANQQRILAAQWVNMKTEIGAALLPVVLTFTTALSTKLMPALTQLWAVHGPKITAWLQQAADKTGPFIDKLLSMDWAGFGASAKAALGPLIDKLKSFDWGAFGTNVTKTFREATPAIKEFGNSAGSQIWDALKVGGVVLQFLATHVDTLAKALPYLALGFVAVKAAQLGANLAATLSVPLKIADVITTRALVSAIKAESAARVANAAATEVSTVAIAGETTVANVSLATRARGLVSLIATKVAMVATAVATGIWTAAQWLLNVALTANPIGLLIVGIGLLVAAIVWIALKTTWFQDLWRVTWGAIKAAASAVVGWITGSAVPWLVNAWNSIGNAIANFRNAALNALGNFLSYVLTLPARVSSALGNLVGSLVSLGADLVSGIVRGIVNSAGRIAGALKDAVSNALSAAKSFLGIGSPSKLAARLIGLPIGQGVVAGIASTAEEVARTIADLTSPGDNTFGASGAGMGGGMRVDNLNIRAYSDRFSLTQVQADLALHGVH